MGIVRDLYYARKMSAGLKLPAPTVALLIKRLRLAAAMGGGVEKTVSGSPAHITDALAKAALSVLVSIEPIQDLHGYSSPWPAGGGKNLFNADAGSNGYINDSGAIVSRTYQFASDFIAVTAGNAYTISAASTMANIGIAYFDSNKAIILPRVDNASRQTLTITPATGVAYVRFWFFKDNSIDLNPTNVKETYKVQFEAGSSATSYAPYSNICPITGRTGLSVYRTGINVWDEQYFVSSNRIQSDYIPVLPNTTYNRVSPNNIIPLYYDADKNQLTTGTWGTGVFTTPADCYYLRFQVDPVYGETYNHDISINYPSTDTDYHAYQGQTISVDWTSEAGTVYGGTLDVVTGLLTVDRASISSYAGETLPGAWISDRDVYAPGTSPTTGAQVVYELATPLMYQLSAQEVQMLLGENYVWSSSGDTVSVTYYSEGNANTLQSLNILLGGNYSNPKTADDVSDKEALDIILGGNK